MNPITVIRRVMRVGNSNVLALPASFAGKVLRVHVVGDSSDYEFEGRAVPFGRGAYVVIPSPLSDELPPNTVVIVNITEVVGHAD